MGLPILSDLNSTGSVTLTWWTSKEFFEKATLFMKKTYGAVARKDLWVELRTSFKLLFKLKEKDEYENHLRIIMEIIKPFQGIYFSYFYCVCHMIFQLYCRWWNGTFCCRCNHWSYRTYQQRGRKFPCKDGEGSNVQVKISTSAFSILVSFCNPKF